MLPAWLVADRQLVVRNYNPFAWELLEAVGKEDLLGSHRLTLELSPTLDNDFESLWHCILDPQSLNDFGLVDTALQILERHFAILKSFHKDTRPLDVIITELNEVQGLKGAVTPYVFPPKPPQEVFRIGVKVSPPEGLRLITPVNLENVEMEYVDLVIAYRVCLHWSSQRLTELHVEGAQPAIHDATFRHTLWARIEAEKRAKVTQFLSHAFQPPVSNITSIVKELRRAELSDYDRTCLARLMAYVDELEHLSNLLVFISTSETVPIVLCTPYSGSRTIWETISIEEVKTAIINTLQSVMAGRTKNPQNPMKVLILAGVSSLEEYKPSLLENVADSILDTSGLGGAFRFGVSVPDDSSYEVAEKVKTTLLNLIFVEMLINALKCSDPKYPHIKVILNINTASGCLDVGVVNNKSTLTDHDLDMDGLSKLVEELEAKHGEKRTALGMRLNIVAAKKLECELHCRKLDHPGTHLVLSIPFEDGGPNAKNCDNRR